MVCPKRARRASGAAALLAGAVLAFAGPAAAHHPETAEAMEPGVGAWRTWVLSSGSQFRLPPPPDAAATRGEIEKLHGMAASLDAEARERIARWDAAAPSYRWNQIAVDAAIKAGLNNNVERIAARAIERASADGAGRAAP